MTSNIVSDLSTNEKWTLLAFLLETQRSAGEIEYLEIGVYAGGTIRFLAEHTPQSVRFTGIDLFEDFVQSSDNTHMWRNYTLEQVSTAANIDRASFYKGDSPSVVESLAKSGKNFHFIFIDGNHTYHGARADFEAAHRVLQPYGLIVFHNSSPGFSHEDRAYLLADGGPWRVTEEIRRMPGYSLEFQVDRMRIFKKLPTSASDAIGAQAETHWESGGPQPECAVGPQGTYR